MLPTPITAVAQRSKYYYSITKDRPSKLSEVRLHSVALSALARRVMSRLTISKVQTRLIHTFSFLPGSTPSTLSSSTPSHQHRRAGLRQNSRSFCAMPTAPALLSLLPALAESAVPRTSVRRRARASEQMTAFLGSPARWPHVASCEKPLRVSVGSSRKEGGWEEPTLR